MDLKDKKIFITLLFVALYLFSELVLPINYAFSHTLYDNDIEWENCDESNQDNQTDQVNVENNDENEVEEIDNNCFLDSLQSSEKHCCTIQNSRLNIENLLSPSLQSYKTVQFSNNSQQQNIIATNFGVRNTLDLLRTVILLN